MCKENDPEAVHIEIKPPQIIKIEPIIRNDIEGILSARMAACKKLSENKGNYQLYYSELYKRLESLYEKVKSQKFDFIIERQ
jgi:hypothetical protein